MRDYGYSLESIERNYGSVAEYNRVMEEEYEYDEEGNLVPRQYEEPSEEELMQQAKEQRIYNRKLEVLSGKPSDFAVALKKEFDDNAPKKEDYSSNDYYYACRKYSSYRTKTVVKKIKEVYGIDLSSDVSPYRLPKGEFAVCIEDRIECPVKHYAARELTYEQFKAVFRDLRYLGENPTMFFGREGEGKTLILSNSSLGSLRYCDFLHYGLETREAMDAEALAINKAEFEANKAFAVVYDGKCKKDFFHECKFHHYIGQISADDMTEYSYCEIGHFCSYDESPMVKGGAA